MARKTEAQAQSDLLNEGALDKLANDSSDYLSLEEMPLVKQTILLSAGSFIERVKSNLNRLGKNDTGGLEDDISQGELLEDRYGYELDLGYEKGSPSAKYWDFVNQGVRGVKNQSIQSEYTFETIYPGPRMVGAIQSWLERGNAGALTENLSSKNMQSSRISNLQRKRVRVMEAVSEADRLRSLAYAVATSIKKKGLKQTRYFDDAIEDTFGSKFFENLSKAVGADIKVYIKQIKKLINENSK